MSGQQRRTKVRYYLYDNVNRGFFELLPETICGRIEGELRFPSDDVLSRKHCRFSIVGNEVYIEDLNSTNKTRVNTVPLRAGHKRRLHFHDLIEFGAQRFVLTNQDKVPPASTDDEGKAPHHYKGVVQDDGSVTSQMTRATKRTRIILDKYSFQKLRLKELLLFPRSFRPRRNPPDDGATRAVHRPRRLAPWIFFFLVFGLASSVMYAWNLRTDRAHLTAANANGISGASRSLASEPLSPAGVGR